MKTKVLLCGIVLSAAVVFSSCGKSDEQIQKEVVTALSAVSSAVSSEVKKGEVTLSGVVESDAVKAEVEKSVSALKDVKSVVNNIEVKLPAPVIAPDDALKALIHAAISSAGDEFKEVIIDVKDSTVTLTGNIKKAHLQKILQVANDTKPKKVINSLNIAK
ncbi:MAG: BON domain-containing protein [Bacteroidales bacterium]|jgi:osmotically-inducible protein OsmY|nr:BON domain-containing protein [Bacteroidales bacterium]